MCKEVQTESKKSVIDAMASRFGMEPAAFESVMTKTLMPGNTKKEELVAFLSVAKEYNLNPLTKEVYAFPSRGGIQPIVSIDGWVRMINNHSQLDGIEFQDTIENGKVTAITCKISRKDRSHPITATEYLEECQRQTDPWKKWPRRMLRHKALIQCARYAFGFSGIYDPDEGERIKEATEVKNVTPQHQTIDTTDLPNVKPQFEEEVNVENAPTEKDPNQAEIFEEENE